MFIQAQKSKEGKAKSFSMTQLMKVFFKAFYAIATPLINVIITLSNGC